MPLKIRCRGCEKVLKVPDRARGKAIRCPGCQATIRIPAAKAEAGAPSESRAKAPSESRAEKGTPKRRRRRQPVRAAAGDGDSFLDGVDLRRAADTRVRVCVKCGEEAPEVEEEEEEVVDCPECGHNIDTGVMSEYQRIKRARKGPDPEEFWGKMWTEPWGFLKKNYPMVFRTAAIWSFFQAAQICCFYVAVHFCDRIPTRILWICLGCLWTLGIGGWLWLTMTRIIRHTMGPQRKKKYEDTAFGYFECFALGYKSVFWAAIVAYPITLTFTVIYLIPLLTAYPALFDSFTPIYIV
ncbi:MAG: hypothetical protein IID45_00170, partial [Planctomycetes bacterium]|nr:hypothetical protein [Planctomycetota bacterium]